jgi:hypothetical protein
MINYAVRVIHDGSLRRRLVISGIGAAPIREPVLVKKRSPTKFFGSGISWFEHLVPKLPVEEQVAGSRPV